MKDFFVKKTWRVDWDMILARKIRRIAKEPTMGSKLKLFFSSIWAFLEPFVKIFLSKAGPLLAEAATRAVTATAQYYSADSDRTKRDVAYDMIESDLKRQGVAIGTEVTTSMINAAIEAAVQKLKAEAR